MYPRSSSRFMQRIMQRSRGCGGNLQRMKVWNQWKYQPYFLLLIPHTNAELQGHLLRDYGNKFEQLSEDQKLSKLCSDAGLKFVEKWTILHFCTWWRRRTRWNEETRSRVHVTPKWRSIPSERVDSRKHENRPGLGCEGLPSSKTLRYRNHGRIPVSRQNSFLGSNCEWDWHIRNRNVRNHFSWKRWAQSHRETCCESKVTTKAYYDTVHHFCSCSWKKLDRYQSREIPSRLFYSVKSHDQFTATWSINSSRRWWSSTIWRYYGRHSRQSSMVFRNGQLTIG